MTVNRTVVLAVAFGISALFLSMIGPFLKAIFLAGLFAALFNPFYQRMRGLVGGREALASGLTVVSALLFVVVPVLVISATVVAQALDIASQAKPWIQQHLAEPGMISEMLSGLPFYDTLLPYRDAVLEHLGTFVGGISKTVVDLVQSATVGTVNVVVLVFVVLYTMFFFLLDGDVLVKKILYYLPLDDSDEQQLLARFTSVGRATLKGTAVIGFLQGAFAGLGFWLLGVPSALLWAVVMMFLSVVPGVGTALIWIPATVYLIAVGEIWQAVVLAVYCAAVVGSIDNVLRPRLVGNDTQLHELMIFFSTLGGIIMFGFAGFMIGPIIAALFVTTWEIYGLEFRDWLPETGFRTRREREADEAQSSLASGADGDEDPQA
ncbi:AI-2E family transporter [Granulosicoccaceae sp. 1_MG-2023]|nr:AI-2E family transporter [Granulosicoccaceae sp. 1_MG-2023]